MPVTRFVDFAPDADSVTPIGSPQTFLQDMNGFYPVAKGYRTLPDIHPISKGLPSVCQGTFSGLQIDTPITVAGTRTQLFILNPSDIQPYDWTSQMLSLTGSDNPWIFDAYGQDIIAVNGVDHVQYKHGSSVFADLPGSPPVASIVQATDYTLFLVIPNSQEYIFSLADTVWTPSIATETVRAPLQSTQGNITAAHKLRSGIAMYKDNAIHMGTFGNPPEFWSFVIVSRFVGVPSQGCVANLGDIHFIWGPDDFYTFDGYNLSRLPNMLKEWLFGNDNLQLTGNLDKPYKKNIQSNIDPGRSLIFWHYPSVDAVPRGTLDRFVCLNWRTGTWAIGQREIEAALQGTIDVGFGPATGFFSSDDHDFHVYGQSLSPVVSGVYLTTSNFGDRHSMYTINRRRPHFTLKPPMAPNGKDAECTTYGTYNPGESATQLNLPEPLSFDGWFNHVTTDRLQRDRYDFHGETEIVGVEIDGVYAGEV